MRFARGYHLPTGARILDLVTRVWAPPDNRPTRATGGYEGSYSFVLQRLHDEVGIAVNFNSGGNYDALIDELDELTNTLPPSASGL